MKKKSFLSSHEHRGFTLVEVMVAVSIFTIVMAVGLGALLTTNLAYRRAQAERTVLDNLSFALEAMTRQMRTGTTYHCGLSGQLYDPADCPGGNDAIAFEQVGGNASDPNDQVVYRRMIDAVTNRGRIERSLAGGAPGSWVSVTSPAIDVQDFFIRVIGAESSDTLQPFAIINIRGEYTVSQEVGTFAIQTSVTPRVIDFQF